MIVWVFSAILFLAAFWLGALTWRRHGRETFRSALQQGAEQFRSLVPRIVVGFLGSGYIAEIMPRDLVLSLFGPGSGAGGYVLAALAGVLVPGGPVVGFALGAAALKAGAGVPQVMAFVIAWSLYTLNRVLVWEVPTMPARFVLTRIIVSLPLPFLVALGAAAVLAQAPGFVRGP